MTDHAIPGRETVRELLEQCSELKVLHGSPEEARGLAERAYAASADPSLLVWRQLAAYRLAHLILRHAAQADDLRRAERLLDEAAGGDGTTGAGDPLASLFRLGALQRLIDDPATTDPERLELVAERRTVFERVGDQLAGRQRIGPNGTATYKAMLNQPEFNMLELAAYFTGERYEPLQGLAPLPFERPRAPWLIVSNRPGWGTVYSTQAFAKLELDQLKLSKPGLTVCCQPNGRPPRINSTSAVQVAMSDDQAVLLANLLWQPGLDSVVMARELGAEPDTLRQNRHRLKQKLTPLHADPPIEPLDRGYRVADTLEVFVAVPVRALVRG